MIADETCALLSIHDRLKPWEQPFIREMARLLEQRGSLASRQLATIQRILDRYRVLMVPAQAAPDQLTLMGRACHPCD